MDFHQAIELDENFFEAQSLLACADLPQGESDETQPFLLKTVEKMEQRLQETSDRAQVAALHLQLAECHMTLAYQTKDREDRARYYRQSTTCKLAGYVVKMYLRQLKDEARYEECISFLTYLQGHTSEYGNTNRLTSFLCGDDTWSLFWNDKMVHIYGRICTGYQPAAVAY